MPAAELRAAARLYASARNAAIYYGLGVTEHSQGSTMVMAMANLAMATGNIGREGVGVNPLRGQNNVQGSCDMGSFPHELPGYRHVSDDAVREVFEQVWGRPIEAEPGLRIPNMFDAALAGTFRAMFVQGEDLAQSDPNTKHVKAALGALDLLVVQDLFLNETAAFAHVFLPGTSFLEKDGTFTNAERRINRVRPVMATRTGPPGVGGGLRAGHGHGLPHALRRREPDHGRDRDGHADLRRGVVQAPRRARQHPVAVQRRGARRHAVHARRRVRARQGSLRRDPVRRHGRAHARASTR